LPGRRLDVFLREKLPEVSRGSIQRLLAEGCIRVDGKIVKPAYAPRMGQTITVDFPEALPAEAQPEAMPLEILFEDESLLVLNKPAGVVVHPAAGHQEHTLVNALLHYCKGQLSGIGGVARPGIVHRLDKDTSGCLVVAKTDSAHIALSEQFANRQIEKIYAAIACGRVTPEAGSIDAAIARHPTQRKKMAVTKRGHAGRSARSSYRTLERWRDATLVEVALHTGRTHQIRVHLAHFGYPVAGDLVYGRRANAVLREKSGYAPPRQLLHARRIGFKHPGSGRRIVVEAQFPDDFSKAIDFFQKKAHC
jgi:23S rRNA pseudouridine1911/1915/1917 synthase